MFSIIKTFFGKRDSKKNLEVVVARQLKENIKAIESLRDYDAGKKEISTDRVESSMRRV